MLYRISKALLNLYFRIMGGMTLVGIENVPEKGGVILAPNHVSYADPPAAGCGLRRQVHFMAKEELFRCKPFALWMKAVGTFPVRRGTADRKALKTAIRLLSEGRVLCIFPEGTRGDGNRLGEAELGIGLIALKTHVPIVPVALIGTKDLSLGRKKTGIRGIKVVYGRPLTFPDLYDAGESRDAVEEVGRRTMAAISDLLKEHKPAS